MLKGSLIIGQSGGPSSVINASAYGVIRTALDADCITKVYGAYHGIKGVSEEKLAGFQVKFEETFGDDAALSPRNLVDSKRMQLKTPDVIIHVAPDRGDLVETRTLGGVKYIMVRAEDGVELNGVDIQIDGN